MLKGFPEGLFHCFVTSWPYLGIKNCVGHFARLSATLQGPVFLPTGVRIYPSHVKIREEEKTIRGQQETGRLRNRLGQAQRSGCWTREGPRQRNAENRQQMGLEVPMWVWRPFSMQLKTCPCLPPFSSTISGDFAQHPNKCLWSLFKTKDVHSYTRTLYQNKLLLTGLCPARGAGRGHRISRLLGHHSMGCSVSQGRVTSRDAGWDGCRTNSMIFC